MFFSILVVLGAPFLGSESMSWELLKIPEYHSIFWQLRVPRVCLAFLAGAVLAVSGMNFQAIFQNILACPFTLGTSSAAAFGAISCIFLGLSFSIAGLDSVSFFAFLWASIAIFIIYTLASIKKNYSKTFMILAGVAINFFFSSMILFVQFLSDFTDSLRILHWLMGGLDIVGFKDIIHILPGTILGLGITILLRSELNLLSLGEEMALARGVNVRRVKGWLCFGTAMMVASIVSVCGPIGFIGIIVPHVGRWIIGFDHRHLWLMSFVLGGTFLVVCDVISHILLSPIVLPIGIVTSFIGCFFFVWLLVKQS